MSLVWVVPTLAVLSNAFGWQILYRFNPAHLVYLFGLALLVPLVAGLYPSLRARKGLRVASLLIR